MSTEGMGSNYVNILDTVFLLKVGEYCHECLSRHLTGVASASLTPLLHSLSKHCSVFQFYCYLKKRNKNQKTQPKQKPKAANL